MVLVWDSVNKAEIIFGVYIEYNNAVKRADDIKANRVTSYDIEDAVLTPAALDAEGRCKNCDWWNANREFKFCPDCGRKLPHQ